MRIGDAIGVLQQQSDLLNQQMAQLKEQTTLSKTNMENYDFRYQFTNNDSNLNDIASILSKAQALSYATQNIAGFFNSNYPGYQTGSDFNQIYRQLSKTTLATANATLQSLNNVYTSGNSITAKTWFFYLSQMVSAGSGTVQTLQGLALVMQEVSDQIALLRTITMAQISTQEAYMAQQVQLDALKQANSDKLINNGISGEINNEVNNDVPEYGAYKVNLDFGR